MKHNIFSKALLIAVTAGLTLSACSPEDFDGVSEAGLPLAENAKVTASVDDETNTVTFHMEGDGIYPMWYIPVDGKEVTMQVKAGDKVIYSKYSGTEVEIEDEKYVIVKQNDILAVVE